MKKLGRCSYISFLAAGGSKRPSDFINLALEKLKNTKTRWLSSPRKNLEKKILLYPIQSSVSHYIEVCTLRIFGTNF